MVKRKIDDFEEGSRSPKLLKLEESCHGFDNPDFERDWSDLPKHIHSEESGWISGKVRMAWPPTPFVKFVITRFRIDGFEDLDTRIEVHIKCEEAKKWKIQVSDVYKISLKGATVEEKKSGRQHSKLIYNDCATLQVVRKNSNPGLNGVILDAWKSASFEVS